MNKVAVVILNWNGIKWLSKFIANVIQNSQPYSVCVIDNASDDDSVGYLQLYHPEVKVVVLDKNYGFAEGYNRGLREIEAEHYVLLNSDVEVGGNWIDPILALFEENPNIAAVQPKILDYNDKSRFEYAGAAGGMLDQYGVPFCRGRMFDDLEQDKGQYEEAKPIFWASGAAFFVKAKKFWEVGGFDGDFFAHMEEIDLCWRLQNAGYDIYYCPFSKVYHVGGGTLNKINPKKYYLNFRNSLWMLLKNLPLAKIIPIIFVRLCLDGMAAIKFAISGKPIMLWVVLKAHLIFYFTLLPTMLKRRRISIKGVPKTLYSKSIIKSYYLEGKKRYLDLLINKST